MFKWEGLSWGLYGVLWSSATWGEIWVGATSLSRPQRQQWKYISSTPMYMYIPAEEKSRIREEPPAHRDLFVLPTTLHPSLRVIVHALQVCHVFLCYPCQCISGRAQACNMPPIVYVQTRSSSLYLYVMYICGMGGDNSWINQSLRDSALLQCRLLICSLSHISRVRSI